MLHTPARLTVAEHDSFSVVWAEADRKTVQKALTRLHPGLYLHRDPQAGAWLVKDRDAGDVIVLSWPRTLSLGVVDAVARQEKRTKADEVDPLAMAKREADRKQKLHEKARDDLDQIRRVHEPILTRITVPFGRTLRGDQ